MERLGRLARRFALDILTVIVAAESAVAVALGHHVRYQPQPGPWFPSRWFPSPWFTVPAIALVVLPLLARRRFPFAAPAAVWLAAAAASFADGRLVVMPASTVIAGMIAAFLLGNAGDGHQAQLGLAIVTCGAVIVTDSNPGHASSDFIFTPLLFAIVWGAGFALRQRAQRAEAAEQRAVRAEEDREDAACLATAQERARIARELHDTVAHAVSVMVLQAGAVRHRLPEAHREHKNALWDVEQTGRTALTDMRHLLDAIRDDSADAGLTPPPGLDRLDRLLEDVERAGLPVRLRVAGERFPLPGGVDISAYRIVQEGLTNVLKHAGATQAEVSLHYAPDQLSIEVRDNGHGATHGSGSGHGLFGIRERVRLYQGEMTTSTPEGGGFLLKTRLALTRHLP
jgi:signal transduction histidine kinase